MQPYLDISYEETGKAYLTQFQSGRTAPSIVERDKIRVSMSRVTGIHQFIGANNVQLVEVILDLGRPPVARFSGEDVRLSEDLVTRLDLQAAVEQVI